MVKYDPIRDNLSAATDSIAIPPSALGTAPSPAFIGDDAITVPAASRTIYAFGDSLSDAGNISLLTAHQLPVSSIYSDGRFSNGNVWVQDLAANLHLPAVTPSISGGTDYAYGGAQTGATAVHPSNPSDLPSQLAQFEVRVPHPSPNALYTVWAGSNNVLDIARLNRNSRATGGERAAGGHQ